MSGDHKASLLLKNVEEERAQMEAMRQPVVEEKDEEHKSEESDTSKEESEEASNSESDSGTVICRILSLLFLHISHLLNSNKRMLLFHHYSFLYLR